jgi:predicted DNA-binding ribbon-helix-helix protein
MCQVFISADPQLWAHRARSIRLHGVATSIRLENLFWQVLEEIAARDGYTVPQLCTKLYDELLAERKAVDNFSSFCACAAPAIWRCSCRARFRRTWAYRFARWAMPRHSSPPARN